MTGDSYGRMCHQISPGGSSSGSPVSANVHVVPSALRDKYFEMVYGLVHSSLAGTPMAGIMPWAWAGDTRPPRP